MVILASNERSIRDCALAKICEYSAHCNGDSDNLNIVDDFNVWLVWKSIGLHVLAFCQVSWIGVHLLYPSDLTSRCDVISDIINIKSTIVGKFWKIFPYLMWKWTYLKYLEIFKMAAILRSGRIFKPKVVPEVESYSKIGHAIAYILSFCSTVQLKYHRSNGNFKIGPTVWPCDIVFWRLTYKNTGFCVMVDYICGPSLVMIGQKLWPASRKMWQFHLNMNIEGTLWCHTVT